MKPLKASHPHSIGRTADKAARPIDVLGAAISLDNLMGMTGRKITYTLVTFISNPADRPMTSTVNLAPPALIMYGTDIANNNATDIDMPQRTGLYKKPIK
jgi:hypothetical protein